MDEDGPSTVAISIEGAGWRAAPDDPVAVCRRAVDATRRGLLAGHWTAEAEVSILLADDATVRALNARYRGQDRATNVLSFPALPLDPTDLPATPPASHAFLGDIALAFETLCREAEAAGRPFADHLAHLVVHGTLHLLGYEHDSETGAVRMEALERRLLAELGIPDPYDDSPAAMSRGTLETTP